MAGSVMSGMPRTTGGAGREPMMGARGGSDWERMDGALESSVARPLPPGRGIAMGFDFAVGLGSLLAAPLSAAAVLMPVKLRPDMFTATSVLPRVYPQM